MRKLRFSILSLVLISCLLLLQYRLWLKPGGIPDLVALKTRLAKQFNENEDLRKRNEELLLQVHRLQNNQESIESRARRELGMIKKDEIFYQVVRDEAEEKKTS